MADILVSYISKHGLDEISVVEVILAMVDSSPMIFPKGLGSPFVACAVPSGACCNLVIIVEIILAVIAPCTAVLAPSVCACLFHSSMCWFFISDAKLAPFRFPSKNFGIYNWFQSFLEPYAIRQGSFL